MDLMAPASAPARFSADEFGELARADAFGDLKMELVEGVLHRLPLNGARHGGLQMSIVAGLAQHLPVPRVRATAGIRLDDATVVGCDAAVIDEKPEGYWLTPAEVMLAVEVEAFDADRALGLKRRLYAAAGIPTYWVVDAARAVVHVFDRPADGDYAGLALVRFGERLGVPGTDGAIVLA
jgi:Uma2 family endonuclease